MFFSSPQFVPKTHYFFSVSKDKTLKYWDADKFEHIMTLKVSHCLRARIISINHQQRIMNLKQLKVRNSVSGVM